MAAKDKEGVITYEVVVNHEMQHSIWPEFRGDPPLGWRKVGKSGLMHDCLAFIGEAWTDLRPLSLRKRMEEMRARRPELENKGARKRESAAEHPRDALVRFLSEGDHPVEVKIRPEETVKLFREAIDRGHVHLKFTDTRGGTELGVKLDTERSDLSHADFEEGIGSIHLEGILTLDYARVRCIAEIDCAAFKGFGHLEAVEE